MVARLQTQVPWLFTSLHSPLPTFQKCLRTSFQRHSPSNHFLPSKAGVCVTISYLPVSSLLPLLTVSPQGAYSACKRVILRSDCGSVLLSPYPWFSVPIRIQPTEAPLAMEMCLVPFLPLSRTAIWQKVSWCFWISWTSLSPQGLCTNGIRLFHFSLGKLQIAWSMLRRSFLFAFLKDGASLPISGHFLTWHFIWFSLYHFLPPVTSFKFDSASIVVLTHSRLNIWKEGWECLYFYGHKISDWVNDWITRTLIW